MQISGTSDREPLKHGLQQSLYSAGSTPPMRRWPPHARAVGGAPTSTSRCRVRRLGARPQRGALRVDGRCPGPAAAGGAGSAARGDPLPVADGYVALQLDPHLPGARLAELLDEPRLASRSSPRPGRASQHVDRAAAILARAPGWARGGRVLHARLAARVPAAASCRARPSSWSARSSRTRRGLALVRGPADVPLARRRSRRCRPRRSGPAGAPGLGGVRRSTGAPRGARHPPRRPSPRGPSRRSTSHRLRDPYMGGLLATWGPRSSRSRRPTGSTRRARRFGPRSSTTTPATTGGPRGPLPGRQPREALAVLDLCSEAGRDVLRALVAESDVLLENFTPARDAQLGPDLRRARESTRG